jgi:hypothetical protein
MRHLPRRLLSLSAVALVVWLAGPSPAAGQDVRDRIRAEVARRHAPDEYFVIEPANPKVAGWDAVVNANVDYLYELAAIR